jgi:hypothetical protein
VPGQVPSPTARIADKDHSRLPRRPRASINIPRISRTSWQAA